MQDMAKRDPVLSAFGQNVRKRRESNDLTQEVPAEGARNVGLFARANWDRPF
jgi:hypothetical protein